MGAVMTMGEALDCDLELLAEVLPEVETAILIGMDDGSID
jgi:hypothetical protein